MVLTTIKKEKKIEKLKCSQMRTTPHQKKYELKKNIFYQFFLGIKFSHP